MNRMSVEIIARELMLLISQSRIHIVSVAVNI